MSSQISEAHPKQRLMFFVVQDINDEIRTLVKQLISDIATSRSWILGAPKFIDIVEDAGSQEIDVQDETLGGVHEIYSALQPSDLPREIDALHLDEVEQIVGHVQRFSLENGLEFEFELDGQYVGTIEDGVLDDTLAKGLLGEWQKHLDSTPSSGK